MVQRLAAEPEPPSKPAGSLTGFTEIAAAGPLLLALGACVLAAWCHSPRRA